MATRPARVNWNRNAAWLSIEPVLTVVGCASINASFVGSLAVFYDTQTQVEQVLFTAFVDSVAMFKQFAYFVDDILDGCNSD